MDEVVDAVNNLTIEDAGYYESNTATARDTQGDLEKITHTRYRNFEQKLFSYRTIPVLPPPTNPGIAVIILMQLSWMRRQAPLGFSGLRGNV